MRGQEKKEKKGQKTKAKERRRKGKSFYV